MENDKKTLEQFFQDYGRHGLRAIITRIVKDNKINENDIKTLFIIVDDYEKLHKEYN